MGLFFLVKKTQEEIEKVLTDTVSYELPWDTKYISHKNFACGSHSSAFRILYKDSIIMESCVDYSANHLSNKLVINDSVMHYFVFESLSSHVLTTSNGGYLWEKYQTSGPEFNKFHIINEELTYCITDRADALFITGIGESDLDRYSGNTTAGTYYITDLGTNVQNIDSTLIEVNDTVTYIINFHN